MLLSHINAIEQVLLAQSSAAQNAGHPNLRGGPREWFIRDFLENHLPTNLEIGHGEIIDQNSKPEPSPGEYRPEVDIVIYRRDLPKITYSKDEAAFLAEGVIATIESKSLLTKDELTKACKASLAHKSLRRNPPIHSLGDFPRNIASYVLAYDGPANVSTVANWLPIISEKLSASADQLIDMIVILGKGVIWQKDKFSALPKSEIPEEKKWVYFEQKEKNLFVLFTQMLTLVANISSPPDTLGYGFKFSFETFGTV
jgi:hypothetical protein